MHWPGPPWTLPRLDHDRGGVRLRQGYAALSRSDSPALLRALIAHEASLPQQAALSYLTATLLTQTTPTRPESVAGAPRSTSAAC